MVNVLKFFIIGFLCLNVLVIVHVMMNMIVFKMTLKRVWPPHSAYEIKPYVKTIPYHPLYNIVVWPIISHFYFLNQTPSIERALSLGFSFMSITMVLDYVMWVLIKHPLSMSIEEFYVKSQPSLALCYLVTFISPMSYLLISALLIT